MKGRPKNPWSKLNFKESLLIACDQRDPKAMETLEHLVADLWQIVSRALRLVILLGTWDDETV